MTLISSGLSKTADFQGDMALYFTRNDRAVRIRSSGRSNCGNKIDNLPSALFARHSPSRAQTSGSAGLPVLRIRSSA